MAEPLLSGGSLSFQQDVPVFVFATRALDAAQNAIKHMVVEFDVRFDFRGELAYHLDVPDRGLPPVAIAIPPGQLARAERGASMMNVCPTFIRDQAGGSLDLSRFCMDVTHDWSGNYARANRAFVLEHNVDSALKGLYGLQRVVGEHMPVAARRLLGRCHRELGQLDESITHYKIALSCACESMQSRFLPVAAGVLSDLGVAYKRKGDLPRAALCLLHSLQLRPNHPQALLTFAATLLEPALVTHACARVLVIGGHRELVVSLLKNVAEVRGVEAESLLQQAEALVPRIQLGDWPLARAELERHDLFCEALEQGKPPHIELEDLDPDSTVRRRRLW
jgi:hypothetical protein